MQQFSVLIAIYDKENPSYFELAMSSVWDEQTIRPDEIILVKDGTLTPELDDVITRWEEKLGDRLKVISLVENVGLTKALNKGLKQCSFDLVARMDSDDISLPQRFKKQLKKFSKTPNLTVLGGLAQEVDLAGHKGNVRKMPISHQAIFDNLFVCPFIHPSIMFRKSSIQSIGSYNDSLMRRQDYDLWFRCGKAGFIFENIPEPLLLYRFSEKTHQRQSIKLALQQALIGYKGVRLLHQPFWKACVCFIPFIRSLLPEHMQHFLYKVTKKFDPRQKAKLDL